MLGQIKGLHHVTSMAGDANDNNAFFTRVLGLRRVKITVNFDAPEHLLGTFVDVTVTESLNNSLRGRLAEAASPA